MHKGRPQHCYTWSSDLNTNTCTQ